MKKIINIYYKEGDKLDNQLSILCKIFKIKTRSKLLVHLVDIYNYKLK